MPTGGYTALIQEGVSFEEFILQCARAFGALIEMRDEPMDAPIMEFQPRPYHSEKLNEAKNTLIRYEAMTDEQWQSEAITHRQKEIAQYEGWNKDKAENKAKYEAMLEKVNAWVPPSDNHTGLKEFMQKQITSSIDFDCKPYDMPKEATWQEFKQAMLLSCQRDIEYHTKGQAEEIQRVNERNEWVRQLKQSIQPVKAA